VVTSLLEVFMDISSQNFKKIAPLNARNILEMTFFGINEKMTANWCWILARCFTAVYFLPHQRPRLIALTDDDYCRNKSSK
jgi:hypothetical protein